MSNLMSPFMSNDASYYSAPFASSYSSPFGYQAAPSYIPLFGVSNNNGASDIMALLVPILMQFIQSMNQQVVSNSQNNLDRNGFVVNNPEPMDPLAILAGASIWGDPHYVGAEGDDYDVHGEPGKIYNILSDKNLQVNTAYKGGGDGITYNGALGITMGGDKVQIDSKANVSINGKVMSDGSYRVGTNTVSKKGSQVVLQIPEYTIKATSMGSHLDVKMESKNVVLDGIKPHGIWGQTADGDGKARKGDKGADAQGGGVLEMLDGTISPKGDKTTYKLYEVKGLFDTNFTNFNRFYG